MKEPQKQNERQGKKMGKKGTAANGNGTSASNVILTKTGKVRKNTKGIPRITSAILAMDEAGRAKWLNDLPSTLSDETKAEIKARMETALKGGTVKGKGKKVDFAALFSGKTVEELTEAQTALTAALESAETAKLNALTAIIEKADAELARLKALRSSASKTAPAPAM